MLDELAEFRLHGSLMFPLLRSGLNVISLQGLQRELPLTFMPVLESWWLNIGAALLQGPLQVHIPTPLPSWTLLKVLSS